MKEYGNNIKWHEDSTNDLQYAINWLYSADGLTLIIPSMNYKITKTITGD